MKVICNRGALLEALLVAGNVVSTRTSKPSLQCVKLTAADDRLTLASTDLEVSIRYSDTEVQVEKPGEALVPAEKLRDIVRENHDDTLAIETTADSVRVRGQDSEYKIFAQSVEDFPPISDFEGEAEYQVRAGTLKQMILQTKFAVAKESTRYAFNGVLLTTKGKKINLVSTDGRRLAQAIGELISSGKGKEGVNVIVPTKALTLIESLANDPEETISFHVTESQIIVRTSNATLTSNLLEGQFPPFEDVIPKETDKKLTVATAELTDAIRRAALLTAVESRSVRFTFSKKGLVLSTKSADAGEATVNLPCKFEGGDIEIGFNSEFLVDALKVAVEGEVTLDMSSASRPGLLRAGTSFLYVIMPLNLQ